MKLVPYNRAAAVAYAHRWAYGRNPAFYNFDGLGGDCTNFMSQCLYAGGGVMDYTPTFGWYYLNLNNRTPSWTGVPYFYDYLTRSRHSLGPAAVETDLHHCEPGDFVQLSFSGTVFGHTAIIVQTGMPASPDSTLVAAHTYDIDYKPLNTYSFHGIRFLHITGVYQYD